MGDLPLAANLAIFALGAGAIWRAGTRLEHYADVIALRTGMGHAFTGMLLLAGATSLPELATTLTAVVLLDNPTLAVHNLLGGVAFQTMILVFADASKRRAGALTYFSPKFVLLIEGIGLVMLLQLTLVGISARHVSAVGSISVWLILLVVAWIGVMYLVYRYRGQPRWTPELADDFPLEEPVREEGAPDPEQEHPLRAIWVRFAALSLVVLVGGWLSAQSAEVLADQTGLGDAFLGATLLAAATSLPELSTTTAAARNGRYTVAISNVFGSNSFDVSLLFLAELLYRGASVMEHADDSLAFITGLGALMTCIYLWGLIERENRSVLGIGWDSAAVVVVYLGGMVVLYTM
jgi:cation:H+ antiporter